MKYPIRQEKKVCHGGVTLYIQILAWIYQSKGQKQTPFKKHTHKHKAILLKEKNNGCLRDVKKIKGEIRKER